MRGRLKVFLHDYTLNYKCKWLSFRTTKFPIPPYNTGWDNMFLDNYNGPAVIHDDGTTIWASMHKVHREDGPAVINEIQERYEWYYDNEEYTLDEFVTLPHVTEEMRIMLILQYG